MFGSWRLGRILGFPVEVNLSFVLLLGLVFVAYGGLIGVGLVLLAFGSVLLHELGHALVARRLGVHVAGIELSFFGGAAKMVQMPRSPSDEIAIAAAGPAVSLMLAGLGFGLGVGLSVPLLAYIGWINVVIAGFNLIPALPMDGGRILRAVLSRRMGLVRATDLAVDIARGVAVVFFVLGLFGAYQLLVLAPMLWLMGSQERLLARALAADDGPPRGLGELGRFYRREPRDRFGGGRPAGFGGLGGFGGGGFGAPDDGGPQFRRFTIRRVGGRMVVVALD